MSENPKVTNELMLEILKDIQRNIHRLAEDGKEAKQTILRLRDDIHGVRGDILSVERRLVEVESRLDRVDTRLGLTESQH